MGRRGAPARGRPRRVGAAGLLASITPAHGGGPLFSGRTVGRRHPRLRTGRGGGIRWCGGAPAGPPDRHTRWHFPGNVPAATALRVLLAHAGVRAPHTGQPFSEALLFAVAGGVGAGMFSFFYEKEGFASFFVSGRHGWRDNLVYFRNALAR